MSKTGSWMLLLYFHSGRPMIIEIVGIFKVGQSRQIFPFRYITKVNYIHFHNINKGT